MPVKVDDPRDIQNAYDERFKDAGDSSRELRNAENSPSDSYANSGIDQLEAYANDSRNQVDAGEKSDTAPWVVNRSKNTAGTSKRSTRQKLINILKKGGPSTGIAGAFAAIIIAISGISGPALLLNHLTAGFLNTWDTRTTTATVRTNKLLVKKLVGDTTSGSCSYVKVVCRFNKPSNSLLKKLEKQNIRALDKAGKSVRTTGLWPNKRPDHYELTRTNGVVSEVSAAQFSSTLENDAEFRKAFHTAYNTRFQNFADSVYQKVLTKFGTSKADKLGDAKDQAAAKEKINAASAGDDVGAKAAQGEGDEAVGGVVKRILGQEFEEIIQKLGKAGKGDAIGLTAGVACLVADGPGIASKVVRTYQMTQLVKLAMVFLTVADKIKAGDATPEQVSVLGTMLTTVYKDSSGNVTNRAAVDSFGVKNGLFGDTDASQETAGHSYKKYQPGGSITASLSGINGITNSKLKKDACNVATNPVTGGAINAALAGTGGGIAIAGINILVGMAVGTALENIAGPLADATASLLQPIFKNILGGLLGDFTANTEGEDLGNGIASGTAHMLGQSANQGGNIPLSPEDAVVFKGTQNEVNLAYAEEDRVNANPFDASNPSTFLGSIATRFIPYTSSMASVSGIFSTLWSVSLGSMSAIASPSIHASSGNEYTLCDDSSINDGSIAVGAFCNIIYAVPSQYLDIDPGEVVQNLVQSRDIDEDTGEPIDGSPLESWMSLCLDGKTDQAANCKINAPGVPEKDQDRLASYALYTIDHQIQKNMDDEDVRDVAGGTSGAGVPSIEGLPDGGVKDTDEGKKQAWAMAAQFIKDLNAIRKNGRGYPFKEITNLSLDYGRSAGTPGNSASGGPCFYGASNCDQCYALTAWFLDKFTTEKIGTTTSSGDGVVAYLRKQGVPTGNEAKVYSVFSYGRAVDGSGAHTGIVIGIDGDYAITLENNFAFNGTLYINRRPKNGDKFRGTGDRTEFAYINGIMKDTPKKY